MKEHGVKRLVVLTAYGLGDSESVASWFMKTVFIHGLLIGFYRDHGVQERITRESGWTSSSRGPSASQTHERQR
jgi:hypothetical protein